VIVTIDHRGRNADDDYLERIAETLRTVKERNKSLFEVRFVQLDIGDIDWWDTPESHNLLEIKRAPDFMRSMVSGHLDDQINRMLTVPGRKFLVKIGRIVKGPRGEAWAERSVAGGLEFPENVTQVQRDKKLTEVNHWTRFEFPITAATNYIASIQASGITVVNVDHPHDDGAVITGLIKWTMKRKHSMRGKK